MLPTLRAALLGLAGLCVLATGAAAQSQTLTMIPHADLKNVDPIWTTAYITRNHGYMVWDVLFAMDEDLQPQPQMVDTWEVSDDGMTYTFTLREGLRWHDGGKVTAEDCVASIKRWGQRDGMGQQLMANVESLEVVNDSTFRLNLSGEFGLVLESLGKLSSNVPFMMPKRYAETDPFEQVPTASVGSGPFRFVEDEWQPGNRVVYEKFEDYVPRDEAPSLAAGGKVAKVDRVVWQYIPDQATALAATLEGEVDYFEQPAHDLLEPMQNDPDVNVVFDQLGVQGWLRPNHLYPPFDNPKARKALMYMMDQSAYMQAAIGANEDFWTACAALFVCGTPYGTDAGADGVLQHNPERAKELLEEAGYDGEPVILMDPTDIPLLHAMSLVTAQLLREIDVNVKVEAMDWSTLTSRRAQQSPPGEGGWNIFHTWWTAPDVLDPVANIGVSGGCKEEAWFGWPCDEQIEEMRAEWARTSDQSRKQELATRIQERAYEVVTYVPTGQWFVPRAYRSNLDGVIAGPVPFLWNISKNGGM